MTTSESRDTGTWSALFGLLVLTTGLLGLMALVAPHLLGVILVLAGFLFFGVFHYVVWGWWLPKVLSPPASEAADENRKNRHET